MSYNGAFAVGLALNLGFVVAEVVFGAAAHSLALLSDAGHNLSDVLGLLLAWVATALTASAPTLRRTYGLRRSSIWAALINAVVLLLVVGGITWEALRRLAHPTPVEGSIVMWVAAAGIVINGGTALMFMSGREKDLNLKGAYMHMASDALVAFGVVVAGFVMRLTGWLWLDPVVSLAIGALITWGTWSLLSEAANLALDGVPSGIDLQEIERYLLGQAGVVAVHDLHIWAMSTTEVALTAHLVKPDAALDDALLTHLCRELHDRYSIEHATIQLELGDADHPCPQANCAESGLLETAGT